MFHFHKYRKNSFLAIPGAPWGRADYVHELLDVAQTIVS